MVIKYLISLLPTTVLPQVSDAAFSHPGKDMGKISPDMCLAHKYSVCLSRVVILWLNSPAIPQRARINIQHLLYSSTLYC